MRPEDIKTARDQAPFVPFRIVFTDGRVVEIPHPDFLFVTKHFVNIAISPDPRTGVPEEAISASPLHVARIEYLQPVS